MKELCRRHGFSEASYYLWRSKFSGMTVSDAKRLRALEAENARLKKLLAESVLENGDPRSTARKLVTAPARRELVRYMKERGLSEHHALRVLSMSASALRYAAIPERDGELRERIVALDHRHRRYGAGMSYMKLRQAGLVVNHKRVEWIYAGERLQVRRRKRKKVPVGERQPLLRPETVNQTWSIDFVFDRTADGRAIKCLTIVDDASTEAVAIQVERSISGIAVTRVLDRLALERGLPRVIRT